MLIGVVSDTHNSIEAINRVIYLFNLRNVNLVLHCGDICLPQYSKEFSNLKCGFKAVFGNNDFYKTDLENIISTFGMIKEEPFSFIIENKSFIMSHHPWAIKSADTDKYDYVLYGHTHKAKILETSKTIFINPGEACGIRYGKRTAAIIDLPNNKTNIFEL
jgi:putative phosphoesterase